MYLVLRICYVESMRYWLMVVILLCSALAPTRSWADGVSHAVIPWTPFAPVQVLPPGDDKIVVVREGEKAPFTGHLYDTNTALRWANWLEQYRVRLKTDVDSTRQLAELSLGRCEEKSALVQTQLQASVTQEQQRATMLQIKLDQGPPFYRTFWFGFATGVVVTGVAVGLTAWGLSAAK